MSILLLDNVQQHVAVAPGTGTTIQLGASLSGAESTTFVGAGAVDATMYAYTILDGTNSEKAYGTYSAATNSITRATRSSSIGGVGGTSPINASANAIISTMQISSSDILNKNGDTIPGALTFNGPVYGLPFGGFRNKIRNGTFDLAQRGTSGSVTSGYTLDGWNVTVTGAGVNWAQYTVGAQNITGTSNGLQLSFSSSSNIGATISQPIESLFAATLTAQTLTLQAWVYNNTGLAFKPTLTVAYATGGTDNYSTSVDDVNVVFLQLCNNATWTKISYTWTDSGNAYNGLKISLNFPSLNVSGKFIVLTAVDVQATPNAPTGLNNPPTLAEMRPIAIEYPLNQRYYYANSGQDYGTFWGGNSTNGAIYWTTTRFPFPMRVTPTITLTSNDNTTGFAATSGTAGASIYGVQEGRTAIATQSGAYYGSAITASAEI